jgi:chromosome partitioning protein
MHTIAFANRKGGVGKTTSTFNLASVLAEHGQQVLMIDADPQVNLTDMCKVEAAGRSLAEVLGREKPGTLPLSDVICTNVFDDVHLVPASEALAASDLALNRPGGAHRLKDALATIEGEFDVALIDCPPGLGMMTLNALVAATDVIIPTQASGLPLRGLRRFFVTIVQIREKLNPDLEHLGVLLTFFDSRLVHHRQVLASITQAQLPLLDTTIRRSVRVEQSTTSGIPLPLFALDYPDASRSADDYRDLGEEIIEKWLSEEPKPIPM